MSFSIHTVYSIVFRLWREKRFKLFLEKVRPQVDESILDVGGYPGTWTGRPLPVAKVRCLNIHEIDWSPDQHPGHAIETVMGDGCFLQEAEQSYAIVFSNSVIEHVGDFDRQRLFAEEARRVGQRLWIQTPAYECPLEPHFMLPFVHWLPVRLRTFVIRWFSPWAWLERADKEKVDVTIAYTQLLTRKQMQQLFPDCQVLTERMPGFIPKSYIAVRSQAPSSGKRSLAEQAKVVKQVEVAESSQSAQLI